MSARREVALSCRGEFARGSPVDATGPIRRTTSKRTSNNQVVGKSLGQLIGELREEAGISRSALAKAAKLSPPEVSRIELEGRTNLRFSTVCRIASVLGISLDDLASRAGLTRIGPIPRKRVQATMANLVSKLDAVESVIARAARQVARARDRLFFDE